MEIVTLEAQELWDPVLLRKSFEHSDVIVAHKAIDSYTCIKSVARFGDGPCTPLPTGDGNVYELYDNTVPGELGNIALDLSALVADAAGRSLCEQESHKAEVLRYQSGASLGMHRDGDGKGVTKMVLTLLGVADFQTENGDVKVRAGDLVMLRGCEFSADYTPLHGTRNNMKRHILLVEPNYVDENIESELLSMTMTNT